MSGHEDLTYDQLKRARMAAVALMDSGVLFIMDRARMSDVISRIDSAVHLKHERDTPALNVNPGKR